MKTISHLEYMKEDSADQISYHHLLVEQFTAQMRDIGMNDDRSIAVGVFIECSLRTIEQLEQKITTIDVEITELKDQKLTLIRMLG